MFMALQEIMGDGDVHGTTGNNGRWEMFMALQEIMGDGKCSWHYRK